MDYQFSISFVAKGEEVLLCQKYLATAKFKAISLAEERKSNFTKILQISDNYKGNVMQVSIKIVANLPFLNIEIKVEDLSKVNTISNDGLSIININSQGLFYDFYLKNDSRKFFAFKNLFRKNVLNLQYDYQKTYQGNNVNQTHYISGSQFSGEMKSEIQKILGTNNLDISYRFDYFYTNGIYVSNQNIKYLITINSDGVYYQKLDLVSNIANGSVNLLNAKLLLSTYDFYNNSFCLCDTSGWSFNSKGSSAINVKHYSEDGKIKGKVFKIDFTESYDKDNNFVLNAVMSSNYEGFLINHEYFDILTPSVKSSDVIFQNPENLSNLTYTQTKKSPIFKRLLNKQSIYYVDDNEYICPISCFFDESDNLKIYNYYFKKTYKQPEIISSSGFTSVNDFYNNDYIKEGNLIINNFDLGNSPSFYNFTFKHGLMINNDQSLLIEDNIGDYCKEFEVSVENGVNYDDFNYKVINNTAPVDLTSYIDVNYTAKIKQINEYINNYIYYYNIFIDGFFNAETKSANLSIDPNSFSSITYNIDIKTQLDNINFWLNENDTENKYNRLQNIVELNDLLKLEHIPLYNIRFLPYLYYINNDILSIFEELTPSYFADILSKFSTINNTIISLNNNISDYKNNVLSSLNDFYLFTQSNKDFSKISIYELNPKINNINLLIEAISTMHVSFNEQINTINTTIQSLSDFYLKIKKYNDTIIDLNDKSFKGYLGFTLNPAISFTSFQNETILVIDNYFLAQKYYNIIISEKVKVKNIKITNFSFLFNYSCRNSLTVYNQQTLIPDYYIVNYDDIGSNSNEIDIRRNGTKINKCSLFKSNEFASYKRTDTYTNGVLSNQTDYILVDTFYNKKDYVFYDNLGNEIDYTFGNIYTNLGNNKYFYSDNYIEYAELLNQDFSLVYLSYSKYKVSNTSCLYTYDNDTLNKTLSSSFSLYNKQIISQNNTLINDYRIMTTFPEKNSNFSFLNYYKSKSINDGVLYFNFVVDANSYKYVMLNNLFSYKDTITTLTNINEYSTINNKLVNFIGKPF